MIDFHCHVDLFPSPTVVVDEIERSGAFVLSVTNTPKAFLGTAQLARGRKRIRTALGLHPQLVAERHGELALFRRLLGETRYVGEIGLDGGDDYSQHFTLQKEIFSEILDACARVGGRVMSIHSRHASGEVVEALAKQRTAGVAVLHWFTGPAKHVDKALSLGAWFSVGLPMLKSQRATSIVRRIPRDRILTETDAPFAAPCDGHYPSAALKELLTALSRLWECDEAEVRKQLRANLTVLAQKAEVFALGSAVK